MCIALKAEKATLRDAEDMAACCNTAADGYLKWRGEACVQTTVHPTGASCRKGQSRHGERRVRIIAQVSQMLASLGAVGTHVSMVDI